MKTAAPTRQTTSPAVEVRALTKTFGTNTVVNDLTLSVMPGEIVALLGASGCGKTTTLRCIAGLETPASGEIRIDGRTVWSDRVAVPPERRGVGMIFQSYAIWPHMTVFENIAYGLRVQHMPRSDIVAAVDEALKMVRLDGLGDRYPSALSGGQQQRVALARSVVSRPAVLLLDEPLSNLDAKLRETMRDEVRSIVNRLGITAIHITHDQAEAMAIADRIAIMKDGAIQQFGTARELYQHPVSRFVADFVGDSTFIETRVESVNGDVAVLDCGGSLTLTTGHIAGLKAGDAITVSIRPEAINISPVMEPADAGWVGAVSRAVFEGSSIHYEIASGELELKVRSRVDVEEGSSVTIRIDPRDVVPMDDSRVEGPGGRTWAAKATQVDRPRFESAVPLGDRMTNR